MRFNKRILGVTVAALAVLLLGNLGIGIAMAQQNTADVPPAAAQQEDGPDQQEQTPYYSGSIAVDQAEYEGMSEADEAAALQGMATISAEEAKAAAAGANAGATPLTVELDNENGVLVYSVEMSNGLDVKVDAGNGQVVHIEQDDTDQEASDLDSVQDESESQADDALEVTPGEEAPPGQ
jgi:uncharacterized membrane protein YkoI